MKKNRMMLQIIFVIFSILFKQGISLLHNNPPSSSVATFRRSQLHSSSTKISLPQPSSLQQQEEKEIKQDIQEHYVLEENGHPAFEVQPPHAGCHFRSTHRMASKKGDKKKSKRFFEGWYYRITLPEDNASFAFIISIEDPFSPGRRKEEGMPLSCLQIMGPNDEYLVQADTDDTKFWAWTTQQALGCTFEVNSGNDEDNNNRMVIPPDEFDSVVESGFQVLPTRIQGKLRGHDGTDGGTLNYNTCSGVAGECDFDFSVRPLVGYGDADGGQKSTAGWLANYPMFEPHWQVTMADGRASGTVRWKDKTYTFTDAPFYAEKNWGGAFPIKWYWCQCNSWNNLPNNDGDDIQLSVTAGGGIRKLPLLPSSDATESLGMVCVHYNNTFYEATPWLGDMEWEVTPWGYWKLIGRCTKGPKPFYVELEAKCKETDGVKLRAPTLKDGMVYFCRDSFYANVTLSLWELEEDGTTKGKLILDKVTSNLGAVEVGGGPWWDTWQDTSRMKKPIQFLIRLPYRWKNLLRRITKRRRRKKLSTTK